MGANRAYDAANCLIDEGANYLISWGTAAALDDSLSPGDVILPEIITDLEGKKYELSDPSKLQIPELIQSYNKKNLRIFRNELAETGEFLDTPEVKKQLQLSTGAWAADMESCAIFRAASEQQLAMNVIRVISDASHHSIPSTVKNHVNKYGQPLFPNFYLSLLLAPQEIVALVQLGLGFRKACNRLKTLSSLFDLIIKKQLTHMTH